MSLLKELETLPADALLIKGVAPIARGDVGNEADVLLRMMRYPRLGQFLILMEQGHYITSPVPNPDMSVAGAARVILGVLEVADTQEVTAIAGGGSGRLHEELAKLSDTDYDRASAQVYEDPIWTWDFDRSRGLIHSIPAFNTLASGMRDHANRQIRDFRDGEELKNGSLMAMQYLAVAGSEA